MLVVMPSGLHLLTEIYVYIYQCFDEREVLQKRKMSH